MRSEVVGTVRRWSRGVQAACARAQSESGGAARSWRGREMPSGDIGLLRAASRGAWWARFLPVLLLTQPLRGLNVGATPAGVVEFDLSGVRWQQLYDHNTGRYYFSDTSNSHTQWEDPRKAGQQAGAGIGGGLVATLALAPIAFLALAMFVRVMYLQMYYPEYLNPRRRAKSGGKGAGRRYVLNSRGSERERRVATPDQTRMSSTRAFPAAQRRRTISGDLHPNSFSNPSHRSTPTHLTHRRGSR